jgi:CheY-like chemotaxis protein
LARLPRAVRPQPSLSRNPAPFRARRKRGTASASRATAERVLLIEDDFLVANQIEAALIDAGFEIAGVGSSADEAIELASSLRPTLCVMDIRLAGGRDGIEAAIEIFKAHGIRCTFATAHAACPPKRPFRSAGCKNPFRGRRWSPPSAAPCASCKAETDLTDGLSRQSCDFQKVLIG